MSALAQANILEFIEQRGKAALPDIYGQFELVGKRVVDDALLALQERRELIRGGDARQIVYAPARARRSAQSDTEYTVIRAKAQELMALSANGHVLRVDLIKALPAVNPKAIDSWIYQEGRAGRLVRVKLGVYRNGQPPPVTTRDRIEALFRAKKRRTRAELYADLSDLNLHSVSTTLSELIAQGRVRAVDNLLTWIGEPLTKPGSIKRGGGRKPSNIDLVQRALADGPKQRQELLAVIVGPKPELTLAELVEFGVVTYDEFTCGYRLPGAQTDCDTNEEPANPADTAAFQNDLDAPAQAVVDAQPATETEPSEERQMSEAPAVYNGIPANAFQVGGQHYKAKAIQPWDYIAANGLGFFEGNVVKYVSRWREKGGIEDLRKARHYLDKLLEVETGATSE